MKIKLLRFIIENKLEYHWHEDDVILFVENYNIQDFHKVLPSGVFDDEGISCQMKDGYFCFMMRTICDYIDAELDEIFPK